MVIVKRIQPLSIHLANQIAAGEVVERPASVLKELLENSLDAGSTHIEITVERGGIGLLRVEDNGVGICEADLKLAIAPHATSKIETLADLENVLSYGFRGEALASIGAVSVLELSSWVEGQAFGWCISTAGREATPKLMPVPKRPGTIVEVKNLFYNTPARRKFLRSEKTELIYLEEVFKRMALSHPAVSFKYQVGNRLQKRLPACYEIESHVKRVALLCGNSFVEASAYIEVESNGLKLWGWLGGSKAMRSQADIQYFYVNGRIVRDKVVMHAIRQAYQSLTEPGRYPAYVLYFEIDPAAVDVNVHPTKHEVRFRESRTVHAFLNYAIQEGLKQEIKTPLCVTSANAVMSQDFSNLNLSPNLNMPVEFLETIDHPNYSQNPKENPVTLWGEPLYLLENELLLLEDEAGLGVLDINAVRRLFMQRALTASYYQEGVSKKPLLMPKSVIVGKSMDSFQLSSIDWEKLGFVFSEIGEEVILVREIPVVLGSQLEHFHTFIPTLLSLENPEACINEIMDYVIQTQPFTLEKSKELLEELAVFEAMEGVSKTSDAIRPWYRKLTLAALKRLF